MDKKHSMAKKVNKEVKVKSTPVKESIIKPEVEKVLKVEKEKIEKVVKATKEVKLPKVEKIIKVEAEKMVTKKVDDKISETAKVPSIACYIQYGKNECTEAEVIEKVKNVWTKQLNKKLEDMNEVKIYIKPEELKAYYVIDGDFTGYIEL